jgi:hypothetical protein
VEHNLALAGAAGFGAIIGWYVYYVNRYRKGDVQFSDLTTLIGVIGGAGITRLFAGDGTAGALGAGDLFGAYGLGLFVGFFGYYCVLLVQVAISANFSIDWFLDGRRIRATDPYWVPEEVGSTIRPEMVPPTATEATPFATETSIARSVLGTAVAPGGAVEPSGAFWCARYPGSRSTSDLLPNFRTCVDAFIEAVRHAGADVQINATYRPPERAYLMHYAYQIGRLGMDPRTVPPMAGVAIAWLHRTATGVPDLAASREAAREMVATYGIRFPPALISRHTQRRGIDMDIGWTGSLKVANAQGEEATIATEPRSGLNPQLHAVGKTYGVIKLVSDPPHWSDDGH